jgi:hypothetical protein
MIDPGKDSSALRMIPIYGFMKKNYPDETGESKKNRPGTFSFSNTKQGIRVNLCNLWTNLFKIRGNSCNSWAIIL